MVDGMTMFVERYADTGGLRINDRSELEQYCYYAAGTVGRLITNLLTRGNVSQKRARRLYDTADEFGLLLQMVTESGVKITRQEVFAVVGAASDADRDSIAELRQTIARKPGHKALH